MKDLDLSCNQATDVGCAALAKALKEVNRTVKDVDLSCNQVTHAGGGAESEPDGVGR